MLNCGICGAMLGTNDTRPEHWDAASYACQLEERVQELRQNEGIERICLMAPPPMYRKGEADPEQAGAIPENETLRIIQGIVQKCARENDAVFIDLYRAMDGHPEYMKDGVHPNRQENQVIAQKVLRHLGLLKK